MTILALAPPRSAVLAPYAPAFAHLHDLRRRIDATLQAMVDTLDALDASTTDLEPEVDDEDSHDRELDESEREPDLGSLETVDQSAWSAGHQPHSPVRSRTRPSALNALWAAWTAAHTAKAGDDPGSADPAVRDRAARERMARIALAARPAESADEIATHFAALTILARGLDGIEAEIEADAAVGSAEIHTFALRIVADIIRLDVDIVPSATRQPSGRTMRVVGATTEAAHV